MDGVHTRFTKVSVHQLGKLLQLFHHMSRGVSVVVLPECLVEPGILFYRFRWPHLSLAFEQCWRSWCNHLQWRHSSRGKWHSSLLRETHLCQIIVCLRSLYASPILCPGAQSTWLSGHDAVHVESQICLHLGGSDHIVFKSSGMMKVQYWYHPCISLFVVGCCRSICVFRNWHDENNI